MARVTATLPARWPNVPALHYALLVGLGAFLFVAISETAPTPQRLIDGVPRLANLVGRMLPPATDPEFLARVADRLIETIYIAVAGTAIGIVLSFPIAFLAARKLSPLGRVRWLARGFVSFCRTVPDLVWALIFVSAVGLGSVAGMLAIVVDTIGFCARFFAEAMEDSDPAPQEALEATGASKLDILFAAVIPDAMPSFINTALFALEKAVRSSVVLGIVGAGGIGQELKANFELFQYPKAATIIIAIFIIVLAMERLTDWLRQRIA